MLGNSLRSVLDCFLHGPWRVGDAGRYVKFIGSVGICASVPGRPSEWLPLFRSELKKCWYCCEEGVDFDFRLLRGISRKSGLVFYGCEVTICSELLKLLHGKTPQRVFCPVSGKCVSYVPVCQLLLSDLSDLR